MDILYPPLVEQSLLFHHKNQRTSLSKAQMYRLMVEKGIITDNGQPTVDALTKGWIKDYYEPEGLSYSSFLKLYPYFSHYDRKILKQIDGFWEVPLSVKEELIKNLESNDLSYDEHVQIKAYLSDR